MKPLLIWLAIVAVIFGAYALITSAVRDTTQVFVVVDSSFQMRAVWSDVQLELDQIDDQEHAEFALATEKGPVHSKVHGANVSTPTSTRFGCHEWTGPFSVASANSACSWSSI